MTLPELSIRRPVLVTCFAILMVVMGIMFFLETPVDLLPNTEFPIVMARVTYEGAGPEEIETLVVKPIEEAVSSIQGVEKLISTSRESMGMVVLQFTMDSNIAESEQKVRDKIASIKSRLPDNADDAVIMRFDSTSEPIINVSFNGNLPSRELYDIAEYTIKPRLEQVKNVAQVEIRGSEKREIQVQLDKKKLRQYEISATEVHSKLALSGVNIPIGKDSKSDTETVFRAMGEFKTIADIENIIVKFYGNDIPIRVKHLGKVVDTEKEATNKAYFNGNRSIIMRISRQAGTNTIEVAEGVLERIGVLRKELAQMEGDLKIAIVKDGAKPIQDNVYDVEETIILGILFAMVVVFFFLGNGRSTVITGLALPNSMIGAFILIGLCGFSINVITLLALSLSVGLLIDDAIVVRENIFRHLEEGTPPRKAALNGTLEVMMAVFATTLVVIAVFGSLAFIDGIVGRFMREFGLTVCFAMLISLFDGLAIAPMLSAYFSGRVGDAEEKKKGIIARIWGCFTRWPLEKFAKFQDWLELKYASLLKGILSYKKTTLFISLVVFSLCMSTLALIPINFVPNSDNGELRVELELPIGTSLDVTDAAALKVNERLQKYEEVDRIMAFVGGGRNGGNEASFTVVLKDQKDRVKKTSEVQAEMRAELKEAFPDYTLSVRETSSMGGGMGQRAFTLNVKGADFATLVPYAQSLVERLKKEPEYKDLDTNYRPGSPEVQISIDDVAMSNYGVNSGMLGNELRTFVAGSIPAVFRENGREYDIRVQLQEDQRNILNDFESTLVPNMNGRLVGLSKVAQLKNEVGPKIIYRYDRESYVEINSDLATKVSLQAAMDKVESIIKTEMPLPENVLYEFTGQGKEMGTMIWSFIKAGLLGILFVYFVLASLYNSFIIPFSIMICLPLSLCGAFLALYLAEENINIFSLITCIMLIGVAAKNAILLVDYIKMLEEKKGMDQSTAIIEGGKRRLRPILMTSMALIAGAIPLAIGLNEASSQRTCMGYAMIGGVLSSTFLTLLVVPAVYSYFDKLNSILRKHVKGPTVAGDLTSAAINLEDLKKGA